MSAKNVSRVGELVQGLKDEEKRLKDELAAAEKNVRDLKSELQKVRSGIRALHGKEMPRRTSKSEAKAAAEPPAQCMELQHEA